MNTEHSASHQPPSRAIKILLAALCVLTLILVGLGAYVRTTGAGLSCPDWPLCYGVVVPDFSIAGVPQEVIHRYIASLVGFLCIVLVALCWRERAAQPKLAKFSIGLLVLVIVQGIFGGLTVTQKLHPHIVTTHLTLGTLFFQLIALATIQAMLAHKNRPLITAEPKVRRLLVLGIVATALQIILGGYVGASGASLACLDFPLCGGALVPENATSHQLVQISHRLLGYVLTAVVLWLFFAVRKSSEGISARRGHFGGMVFMIFLQIIIGVGNIHMKIAPAMSVVHLLLAQLILFGLTSAQGQISPRWQIVRKV